MKLYYTPGACSLSPHIILRETGLKFDVERVDLRSKKTETGVDFNTVNPKGYVPTLVLDNGAMLTEGPAIAQYIADQAPQSKLAPANGTFERYQLQEMLNFIATELHKAFSPLFNPAFPDEGKRIFRDRIALRLKTFDTLLAKNAYVMGEQFTIADAYLFTVLNWTRPMQIDLEPYPAVKAYHARIAARPHVQAAMAAEGLTK
ncbi:glutathione transferase GstA [Myxococcus stipitatus]|uniref:glutathione transferase GstA n=1 Tax=Myxococcus stipitatus TaxID=83455 RepID=UPI0030D4E417